MSYEACARCDKTITNEEQHHLCAECARTLLSCTATLPSNHDKRCSLRPGHQGPHATEDYTWTSHRFMNEEVGLMVPVRVKLRCNNAACSYEGWEVPIAGKTTVGKCRKCGHSWSTILAVEVADTRAADTVAELSKKYDVVAKEPMSSETVACSCMDSWKEHELAKHGKHQWFCKLSAETVAGAPLPTRTQPGEVEATLLRNMAPFSAEDRERAEKLLQTLAGCFESDAMDTRLIQPAMMNILIAFHQIRMDAAVKALKFTITEHGKTALEDRAPNPFLDELEKHRALVERVRTGHTLDSRHEAILADAVWFLLAVAHQP